MSFSRLGHELAQGDVLEAIIKHNSPTFVLNMDKRLDAWIPYGKLQFVSHGKKD